MAVRNIATSDTLETFRTQFNAMTLNDFGDIATLNAGLTATTLVGSVNEIYVTAGSAIPGKVEGTDFPSGLLVGHSTTGTLDNASGNTGVGIGACDAITSGDYNTCLGYNAGTSINAGGYNTLIGHTAGIYLGSTGSASFNTAVGKNSLYYAGQGGNNANRNTAVGYASGDSIIQGDRNLCLGSLSGQNITSGSGNVTVGEVDVASATGNRQLMIAGYDGSTRTTWISGDSSGNVTFPATATATAFSGDGSSLSGITSLANNAV